MAEQLGTAGDYHLLTQWGFVLLKDLPAKRRAIFDAARKRKDGWFDMRTKTGKAAARQFHIVNRWHRRVWTRKPALDRFDPLA